MPRKKGGSDGSNSEQSPPVHDLTGSGAGPHFQYGNPPGYQATQGQGGVALDHGGFQTPDAVFCVADPMREQSFVRLKELCDGKVEDDVIHLILSQCDWKVDEAAEKVLQLGWGDPGRTTESIAVPPYVAQGIDSQSKSLKINLRSRIPSHTSPDGGGLPVLSPKTPNLMPEFSELLPYNQNKSPLPIHTGLEALDSFGGTTANVYMDRSVSMDAFTNSFSSVDSSAIPSEVHGVGLTPVDSGPVAGSLFVQGSVPNKEGPGLSTIVEHQRTDSLSPGSAGEQRTSPVYPPIPSHQFPMGPQEMSGGFPSSVGLRMTAPQLTSVNKGESLDSKQISYPKPPRGSRKKTLSLNPEEREALENLIEDVIMDGVADSDELSTSSEGEDSEVNDSGKEQTKKKLEPGKVEVQQKAGSQAGKEGMPKIYPAQLKVAVKHMRNLPPRFMRRLENAQKKIDAAEKQEQDRQRDERVRVEAEALEKEREKMKVREDQKREKKKKIRNLLDDLDQYTDEQNVTEKDSEKRVEKSKGRSKGKDQQGMPPEVEAIQESSQPVHIGLSKGQRANKAQAEDITNELAQKLLGQKLISGQGLPKVMQPNAVNCEDLERELLGEPVTMNVDPNFTMQMGQPAYLPYGYPGMPNPGEKTHLSADAPEFVPFHSFAISSQPAGVPFPASPLLPGPNSHIQAASSPIPQTDTSPHAHTGRPHLMGAKFNPTPKEGPVMSADVMRTKTTNSFSGPHGRISPQVASPGNMGRLSPQVAPTSNTPVQPTIGPQPVVPQHPPSSLPSEQMKNPAFMVPKMPTNIPPPPSTTGITTHPGVGVMAMNPYSVPYPFPGFAAQGFPFRQQFVPPHGFVPWAGDGTPDKHSQGPPMPHHPLVGMPLKASPQLGRKKGPHHHHHHPGPRHQGTGHRPAFMPHNKPSPSDVKVMSADVAKKHIQQLLKDGKKVLVILRGCPGSGKSTLAKEILYEGVALSTDDYFLNSQGVYEYDLAKLDEAHLWNQNRAKQAMEGGSNPVIIDNTNSQTWEMKSYVNFGNKNGYHIEIIEADTPWRHNAKELTKRNNHQVTLETIRRMLDRYEHNVTLQSIMGASEKKSADQEKDQEAIDGEQTAKKTPRRRKKKKVPTATLR